MGLELPSFLVNDKSIPRLSDVPKTPGTGQNGPYPNLPRRHEPSRPHGGARDSGHDSAAKRDKHGVHSAQHNSQPHSSQSHGAQHSSQSHSAQSHSAQSHSAQSHSAQSHSAQSHSAQSHSAQSHSAQSHSAQSHNAQQHSAQQHSAQQHSVKPHDGLHDYRDAPADADVHCSAKDTSSSSLRDAKRSSPRTNTSNISMSSIQDDSELFYTASSPSANSIKSTASPQSSPVTASAPQLRRQTTARPTEQLPSVQIPWDLENPQKWTNDRVIWWLENNGFGPQWTETFRRKNIEKEAFRELTSYRNVKRLGISESPARFIRLLRAVFPTHATNSVAPSPTRVSAPSINYPDNPSVDSVQSSGSSTNSSANSQPRHPVYPLPQASHPHGHPHQHHPPQPQAPPPPPPPPPPKMQPKQDQQDQKRSHQTPHQLVGARRTSLEKFLFLDHRLRPKRSIKPGPSILVTSDDVCFRLVGITDSRNSADVRRRVYSELLQCECKDEDSELSVKIRFRLTDYYCEPGDALNDEQLWAVLSAAAGDIVKFNLEIVGSRPLPLPSRTAAITPGWAMSSEDAMSPPGPLGSRLYPPTPAHLTNAMGGNGGDYFDLKLPKNRDGRALVVSKDPRSRSSSSSSNSAAHHQVYGSLVAGGTGSAGSLPSGSSEQLVALRAAPKPPLARSASSKYRPELSPVMSSSPNRDFGEDSKTEDDETWADAPELESSSDGNGDAEDDDDDDDGMWAKPPVSVNKSSPQSAPETSSGPTLVRPSRSSSIGPPVPPKIEPPSREIDEESESTPMLPASRGAEQMQRKQRRKSEVSFNPVVEEKEADTETDEMPMSLSLVVPRHGHSATPSESSIDSPRSPDPGSIEPSIDWASRPPAEVLYENLERFFPNTDLDKPVVVAKPGGPQSPYLAQRSGNPRFTHIQAPKAAPPPIPPATHDGGGSRSGSPAAIPEESKEQRLAAVRGSDSGRSHGVSVFAPTPATTRTASPVAPGPAPSAANPVAPPNGDDEAPLTPPSIAGVGRAKSIRVVAREASRRLRQGQQQGQNNLLRRKSTKMWGQRVVEMRKGTSSAVTLRDHKEYVWIKGEMIGQGSFGKVYLGLNATTGDMMAVKQVKAPRRGGSHNNPDDSMRALYAEVENMKDLDHLNIVQYLGFERLDRVSNLFLEYVPGGSVKSLLINFGRFPEVTIRFMIIQVLNGLSYLHSRGILHRDLKADNLLLDIDGTIKISDFGISKRSRDIYANNAEMSMQGTIFWMAPEVIHNVVKSQKQGYSAKVDIWSLGCVILEMFVGRRPWSTEEAIGAMYKLGSSRQAPPIPEDAKPYVSDEGKEFLDSCFIIDPNERPTARELLNRKFCVPDPNYDFCKTKLGIELRKSVKRTSTLLRTQSNTQ